MRSINERDNSIKREFIPNLIIHKKCLRNWPRISKPSRFDQDVVEFISSFHQVAKNPDQIPSHSATNAPIRHLKDLFISIDHKTLINANFPILILNDSNAFTMFFAEYFIQ